MVKKWAFWPLKHRFLPFNREHLENGKSWRYISIRAKHQLNNSFLKM